MEVCFAVDMLRARCVSAGEVEDGNEWLNKVKEENWRFERLQCSDSSLSALSIYCLRTSADAGCCGLTTEGWTICLCTTFQVPNAALRRAAERSVCRPCEPLEICLRELRVKGVAREEGALAWWTLPTIREPCCGSRDLGKLRHRMQPRP